MKLALPLLSLFLGLSYLSATEVIREAHTGDVELNRIQVIHFAPDGVLLIADGTKSQIFAVETGDTTAATTRFQPIPGFQKELASKMGVGENDLDIIDMEVNPISKNLYVACFNQKTRTPGLIRIDRDGTMTPVTLKGVKHVRIPLPKGEKAPVSVITDMVWIDNRLIAAARCNEEFASKIFSVDGPLQHEKGGQVYSAETFHVAHNRWETKAPMSVMIPYEEDGKHYIVGAFSCTPVVKYPIDAIKPGAVIKGISMIELGSGNRPLDMFGYSTEGKSKVLTNTFRFHHEKRPYGPSPHLAFRFDQELLSAPEVNDKAVRRLKGNTPATEQIQIAETYHGVVKMSRLDDESALALSETGDLVTIALP
ncbi:MAG: hypothetical protein P1U89_17220 [Verrucomicrobiales bacterium]|nr:hypothetical protein [Verrucomicrobiales bacterium]